MSIPHINCNFNFNPVSHLRFDPCDGDDHLDALDLLLPGVRGHVGLGAVVRLHPRHLLVRELVLQAADLGQVGVRQAVLLVVEPGRRERSRSATAIPAAATAATAAATTTTSAQATTTTTVQATAVTTTTA